MHVAYMYTAHHPSSIAEEEVRDTREELMDLKNQLDHLQSSNGNSNDTITEVSLSLDGFDLQNATAKMEEKAFATSAVLKRTTEHCTSMHIHTHTCIHACTCTKITYTCTCMQT